MIIKNALAVNHFSEDMNMARRDNGTGTVYQRPNGSWVGRIYMGRGADGKPKYKCFSGKSQAEVKRKIKEFNQGGCKTDSTKVSVEEYILNWLKLYKKGSIKDSSYDAIEKTVRNHIIPALDKIGQEFEQKKVFLPQLLMSAEAASASFEVIKGAMPKGTADQSRMMVLATVQGDIHDIGKNIVKVLMESFGFNVIDLGRDVPPQTVLEAVQKSGCRLVGLSALMTTTVPAMEQTIRLLKENVPNVNVVVGGAVLTQEYADMIGADFYAPEAMSTVRYSEEFYNNPDSVK